MMIGRKKMAAGKEPEVYSLYALGEVEYARSDTG